MAVRSEAVLALRDQMSEGLKRIESHSKGTDRALEHLDKTADRFNANRSVEAWASRNDKALDSFDKHVDSSIKKVGELRAAVDALGHDKVTAEVKVKGVKEALAETMALRAMLASMGGKQITLPSDVRAALLNLQSSAEQVSVARSNIDLAEQTLVQSRVRFSAGVTDTVEVVQSQEAVASAHEQYISSLYNYNFSKISLVRALGIGEEGVKEYFKGK